MRVASMIALILLLLGASTSAAEWRFDGVERVVAISDPHGAHAAFLKTLAASGIVDEEQRWSAGETHLVINGDILDRGDDSRDSMDLLMRLEGEAAAAGGRVHILLGNHEAMVLIGDLRYVAAGEYAAFSDEASDDERDRWYAALVARDGELERATFDADYPRGFFAHRRGYAYNGKYGEWLLQKPAMILINDTAFVHAGMSSLLGELGFDGVNVGLVGEMRDYETLLGSLYADQLLLPTDNYFDHESLMRAQIATITAEDANDLRIARLERAIELGNSRLHGPDGPLWYRGNIACSGLVEIDRLDAALQAIGATRVVVGHTPTPDRSILERFDGRVIEIDTGMNNAVYGGEGNALLIENGRLSTISQNGETPAGVAKHPRQVGSRPGGFLSLDDTLALLADGDIVKRGSFGDGRRTVTLEMGERRIDAVFTPAQRRGVMPELAAYRLDRLLGLDKVPATVERTIDETRGSLQFLVPRTIDEQQRATSGRGGGAMCALSDQWANMYVFDALIHNAARTQQRTRYDRNRGFQLILTGHDQAFSTSRGFPDYLSNVDLAVSEAWRRRLQALDDDVIEAQFSDVLDRRRMKALAGRRELLLKRGN
ncbi:MAG: metallophosphoesterase [Pseudomonadota bacterium]